MAKFKILFICDNISVTDSLFKALNNDYLILTCSGKQEDIDNHLEVVSPDVFLMYASESQKPFYETIISFKRKLTQKEIIMGVVGQEADCAAFQTASTNMADMEMHVPLNMEEIRSKINRLIEEREIMKMDRELSTGINEAAGVMESRKKILVIDDDKLMLKVVKEQLQDEYDVAAAISGSAAFKYLETKKADLILLDFNMPVEDGPTILKKLHATPEYAKIPVIFLTGVTEKSKIAEVVALKPQGYMVKPIDKEKLLGVLDKFFAVK